MVQAELQLEVIMAIAKDFFNRFGLHGFAGYEAKWAGTQGDIDLTSKLLSTGRIPFVQNAAVDTTVHITTTFNTYFKMQGYNPLTLQYEIWHSQGEPLMDPPSGNTLDEVSIIATWQDR